MRGRPGLVVTMSLGALLMGCSQHAPSVPSAGGSPGSPVAVASSAPASVSSASPARGQGPAPTASGLAVSPAPTGGTPVPGASAGTASPAASVGATPSADATTGSAGTAGASSAGTGRTGEGTGFVKNVLSDPPALEIAHQALKDLDLPVETTDFVVRDAQLLKGIQAGDAVRFTVTVSPEGDPIITAVEKDRL